MFVSTMPDKTFYILRKLRFVVVYPSPSTNMEKQIQTYFYRFLNPCSLHLLPLFYAKDAQYMFAVYDVNLDIPELKGFFFQLEPFNSSDSCIFKCINALFWSLTPTGTYI